MKPAFLFSFSISLNESTMGKSSWDGAIPTGTSRRSHLLYWQRWGPYPALVYLSCLNLSKTESGDPCLVSGHLIAVIQGLLLSLPPNTPYLI